MPTFSFNRETGRYRAQVALAENVTLAVTHPDMATAMSKLTELIKVWYKGR